MRGFLSHRERQLRIRLAATTKPPRNRQMPMVPGLPGEAQAAFRPGEFCLQLGLFSDCILDVA